MSNHETNARIAVLGLGAMGAALARAAMATGLPVNIWNRNPRRADALASEGARHAESASQAVIDARLVIVCVSDYEAVSEVLEPLADQLTGRVIVNLTSGSSAEARNMAARVAEFGASYIDGAVMAGPSDLGTEETVILFSGPRVAYDEHGSTFEGIAGRATYLGEDPGLSSIYDVSVLTVMWAVLNGFLHGAALLKRAGVSAADFLPIAKNGIATTSGWLDGYAQQIDDDSHPGDDSTLATHVAAMQHLLDESLAANVDLAIPHSFKTLGDRAIEAGLAEHGYTAIINLLLADR